MTPDLWILWAFFTFGSIGASSQAAAFKSEQACEAAKARLVEASVTSKYGGGFAVCTPNFQVSPK